MEYIWIAGPSGVGKTTFIENLLRPEGQELRRRFGIGGPLVRAYGMDSNDDVVGESLAVAQGDHILIHWRFRVHDHIMRLWEDRPDCGHRIILLWRPLDVVREVLEQRGPRWNASDKGVESEWQRVKCRFRGIDQTHVPIEVVDASQCGYPVLAVWP